MTTAAPAEKQNFTFQAEIKQLLHLLAHSLYQGKEIALRELISNASDALDKMRFVALTDETQRDDQPLRINIELDGENKRLTIADNGIGMTKDELVTNLGTIAHSGSLEFLKNLSGDSRKDVSLIGQFGVGFYSAFMIADLVQVYSRGYQEESGWLWESDGSGSFQVQPAEGLPRGTRVVLHLKPEVHDFVMESRIKHILKTYSSFVPHPIMIGDKQVNDVRPIWVEPKSKLTDEQYAGFYAHLTHRGDEKPLWHLHVSADSPIQFHAVLFCPASNLERMGFRPVDHGLHLCAKRILVQNDCRDLLPDYLRFLEGLVDSEDLPLNVSRETLQDNSVFRKIRTTLIKKVIDRLTQLADENAEGYRIFYDQFGTLLKEGVATDFDNRERLAKLLRFASSKSDGKVDVNLEAYVKRCIDGQKQIYYIGGPDLAAIQKNPNLEIFNKRGLEVLFMTEPVDEFVMSALREFDGKELISIDAAELTLPAGAIESATEKSELPPGGFGRVLEMFRAAIGDAVADVRESKRLTDSPCCLVNPDGGMSGQMQKIMRQANRDFPQPKRIFEINPHNPLVRQLSNLSANPQHDEFIKLCGRQLFANAQILEGQFPQPQDLVARVQTLMEQAADSRSPIIV